MAKKINKPNRPKPTITITVAGEFGTGTSTVAYQIQHLLMGFGLKVNHPEPELNENAAFKRLLSPLDYLKTIRDNGTRIIIREQKIGYSGNECSLPITKDTPDWYGYPPDKDEGVSKP
jgi:hypothetical protein